MKITEESLRTKKKPSENKKKLIIFSLIIQLKILSNIVLATDNVIVYEYKKKEKKSPEKN